MNIYLGSVGLEKNRWSSRIPSVYMTEWAERIKKDYFDGIEIWEGHFTSLSREDKLYLRRSGMISVFNCYCAFDKGLTEHLRGVSECIAESGAKAVKYNIGAPGVSLEEQMETFIRWTEMIPDEVSFLCECHDGTQMEDVSTAGGFFDKLNADKHGAILHLCDEEVLMDERIRRYGERIYHIHSQYSAGGRAVRLDECTGETEPLLRRAISKLPSLKSITVEFTQEGIALEDTYGNMVADREFIKRCLT